MLASRLLGGFSGVVFLAIGDPFIEFKSATRAGPA